MRLRNVASLALFAAGCQSIAGIEDRHFEEEISGTPECEAYCDDVETGCELDASGASHYSVNLSIFKALCPRHAPADID